MTNGCCTDLELPSGLNVVAGQAVGITSRMRASSLCTMHVLQEQFWTGTVDRARRWSAMAQLCPFDTDMLMVGTEGVGPENMYLALDDETHMVVEDFF